jgi:hypothetical protein
MCFRTRQRAFSNGEQPAKELYSHHLMIHTPSVLYYWKKDALPLIASQRTPRCFGETKRPRERRRGRDAERRARNDGME